MLRYNPRAYRFGFKFGRELSKRDVNSTKEQGLLISCYKRANVALSLPLLSGEDYKRIAKFRCSILREFCARRNYADQAPQRLELVRLLMRADARSVFNGTLTAAVLS